MNVLVIVASRHGSTREIAERLVRRLETQGHRPTLADVDTWRGDLAAYDAFVVGSAVYEGRWLREARRFIKHHHEALRDRPVWLFSSGPLGDATIGVDTQHLAELCEEIDPVGYHQFGGRLDRANLGRLERWIVDVVRADEGDFRDWDEVEQFASDVAAYLDREAPATEGVPPTA